MISNFVAKPLFMRQVASNPLGRDWAVGDIHGCFSRLQADLDLLGFNPDQDRLFSVGDLVDRGPESDQVLEWLDKPWFFAVTGNHELMTWRRALANPLSWVQHEKHGGQWLDELSPASQQELGQRLAELPIALEVQTPNGAVGLIHADLPSDDWLDVYSLEWCEERLGQVATPEGRSIWVSERLRYMYEAEVANLHALVHGHSLTEQPVRLGNVFFIETGGWQAGGYFSFLDLNSLRLTKGRVCSG